MAHPNYRKLKLKAIMPIKRLKTAVLGLNAQGIQLLKAACQTGYFNILAVGDKNQKTAEEISMKYQCKAYDDYRQLIIQNEFDCVLASAPLYTCAEHLKLAIKKKFHVFKTAPPAGDFEQASEFVRLAKNENVVFSIFNPGRFIRIFQTVNEYILQHPKESISLISIHCNFNEDAFENWQNDPKLAGGGIILNQCYDIIDQLIINFGVPQQVYALNTIKTGNRQKRHYFTEDTAVLCLKFNDLLFASLIARKTRQPDLYLMQIYTDNETVTVNNSHFRVFDERGDLLTEVKREENNLDPIKSALQNYAEHILMPKQTKLISSAEENLKNMALIESAYLSSRTAMPEEPARILQMKILT